MRFNDFVESSVIGSNDFSIREVRDLKSINSLHYNSEFYMLIEELILKNNLSEIKEMVLNSPNNREYLEIMTFTDEKSNNYIVTVYDNDLLEQDPQVIKIYPISPECSN